MKISSASEIPREPTLDGLQKFLSLFCKDVSSILNGNVTFADNFKAQVLSVSFAAANTDKKISHTLGKIPVGYLLIGSTVAASLYTGTVAATSSVITLKSSAVANTTILLF